MKGVVVTECLECGEPIPELRSRQGYVLCVICADARERRQQVASPAKNPHLKPKSVNYDAEATTHRRDHIRSLYEAAEKDGLDWSLHFTPKR